MAEFSIIVYLLQIKLHDRQTQATGRKDRDSSTLMSAHKLQLEHQTSMQTTFFV